MSEANPEHIRVLTDEQRHSRDFNNYALQAESRLVGGYYGRLLDAGVRYLDSVSILTRDMDEQEEAQFVADDTEKRRAKILGEARSEGVSGFTKGLFAVGVGCTALSMAIGPGFPPEAGPINLDFFPNVIALCMGSVALGVSTGYYLWEKKVQSIKSKWQGFVHSATASGETLDAYETVQRDIQTIEDIRYRGMDQTGALKGLFISLGIITLRVGAEVQGWL